MEQRHWWNGRPGADGREDVWLAPVAGCWLLEHHQNGSSWRRAYSTEQEALAVLALGLADGQAWREVTRGVARGRDRTAAPG